MWPWISNLKKKDLYSTVLVIIIINMFCLEWSRWSLEAITTHHIQILYNIQDGGISVQYILILTLAFHFQIYSNIIKQHEDTL